MNEQLIKFIELCLMDGVVTDKEREVIFRKSKELGVPEDECEIILEGMIQQKGSSISENVIVKEEIKVDSEKTEFPLKEFKNLKKLNFNGKNSLEKLIVEENEQFRNLDKKTSNLKNNLKDLEISHKTQKEDLFIEIYKFLKESKVKQVLKLKDFEFRIDDIIESENIKNYLDSFGTIEWGDPERISRPERDILSIDLNPEYPHPISVIFNYTILGETDNPEEYGCFLFKNGLKYYEKKESNLLDLDIHPERVLLYNKNRNECIVIVLLENDFKIIELNYIVSKHQIIHYKINMEDKFYRVLIGRDYPFHSRIIVERKFIDIKKTYNLKNS